MEQPAPWRALETASSDAEGGGKPDEQRDLPNGAKVGLFAAAVAAIGLAVAAVAFASAPGQPVTVTGSSGSSQAAPSHAAAVVVEVSGAVARPGVYELPAGSRVRDAIAAAGGYAHDVDAAAADAQLNLATRIADGQLIRVPRHADAGSPGAAAPSGSASIDLNSATADQLDSLPGIGPVTAAKIIAAREQQPFASVDELVTRKLISASTLDKLRDLVTVS